MPPRKPYRPGAAPRRPGRPRRARPVPQIQAGLWLYGVHPVRAALQNPARRCRRLVVSDPALLERLGASMPAETMDPRTLDALLPPGAVHQGVALLVEPLPGISLEDICTASVADAIIVVLDRVTDPQNVGAVMRSAAAFGARALVVTDRHAPPVSGALAKAAAGAVEHLPLVRVGNLAMALARLQRADFWCIGLDGEAASGIDEAPRSGKRALVLGAEDRGMRRRTRELCDKLVRIPIDPAVQSLNVSNAAAIALYALVDPRTRD